MPMSPVEQPRAGNSALLTDPQIMGSPCGMNSGSTGTQVGTSNIGASVGPRPAGPGVPNPVAGAGDT